MFSHNLQGEPKAGGIVTTQALIVDDEPDIRELLELTLNRMHIQTQCVENVTQAKETLKKNRFELCLTDMKLPDGNGIDLVEHIQNHYPNIPVAVITAHGNMEFAIKALKAGAFDFVSKPVELQVLRTLVNSALKNPNKKINPELQLLGNSSSICDLRKKIKKLSRSQAPIYISGESGSGKELVARLIHDQGQRSSGPFIPVNCGAIPENLMESEFFGYTKGSFTGADKDKIGLFQAADGGTLFLDEVADLPMHMQVKLLRAIQEKAIRPIGAAKEVTIDVRILSATHKALDQMVHEGKFRQDLFYRINVIEIAVPSLRERPEDVAELCEHILQKFHGERIRIDGKALEKLQAYSFPGNVRELENILERAMTLCEDDVIQEDDLSLPKHQRNLDKSAQGDEPLEDLLDKIEREKITQALRNSNNNKTAAAKLLGLSFRALRYRLKKLGID